MTIQEMFEREDIYSIIEETLPTYYNKVFNREITANISKQRLFRRLLIYPRLGIIVPRFPSKNVRKEVYAWFDVQNNIIKKVIAKLYIALCFSTFGMLAHRSLELSDYSVCNQDTLIIPSNRKIRIYDFQHMHVDSIVKSGFKDFYFNNEVEIRDKLNYPFILKVNQCGKRWYRETLLRGRGLVRIPHKKYSEYLQMVLSDLEIVYNDSLTYIPISTYCSNLIQQRLETLNKLVEIGKIKCVERLQNLISTCSSITTHVSDTVPVVLSHGDLQTGNIHIDQDNEKVYIIDWETGAMRSIWYDAATVLCGTRRKDCFSDMINHRFDDTVRERILHFDKKKERNMNVVAAVLLLEELGFFLDEMADFPQTIGSEIIDRFLHELNSITWSSFT